MRGFNTPRPLEGNLTVRARVRGDTQGFVLSDALFVLDNMPEYGIEAHGNMKYDLGGSKEIQLTASGELTSLEAALGWLSIDLSPLGRAMGSATISGTLEKPLVEQFILRSENDQGLTVNIQGRPGSAIEECYPKQGNDRHFRPDSDRPVAMDRETTPMTRALLVPVEYWSVHSRR